MTIKNCAHRDTPLTHTYIQLVAQTTLVSHSVPSVPDFKCTKEAANWILLQGLSATRLAMQQQARDGCCPKNPNPCQLAVFVRLSSILCVFMCISATELLFLTSSCRSNIVSFKVGRRPRYGCEVLFDCPIIWDIPTVWGVAWCMPIHTYLDIAFYSTPTLKNWAYLIQ